jgi:hypothetical protein
MLERREHFISFVPQERWATALIGRIYDRLDILDGSAEYCQGRKLLSLPSTPGLQARR